MKKTAADQRGFTLVEMMIAVAIFGVVMASVYGIYQAQMRSHYVQQQVVDMQQNIRTAMYLMERDIKLAGLNPTGASGIGVTAATGHSLEFNLDNSGGLFDGNDNDGDGIFDEGDNDIDDNGDPGGFVDEPDEAEWYDGAADDPGEVVKYRLSNDTDGNGINDGLPGDADGDGAPCNLERWTTYKDEFNNIVGAYKTLAMNIDALNFVYLDKDGNPADDTDGDGSPDDLRDIRTVQVTLVARSSATPSYFFSDQGGTESYLNQQGDEILPAQNDTFRRMMMTMEVTCRNLGL